MQPFQMADTKTKMSDVHVCKEDMLVSFSWRDNISHTTAVNLKISLAVVVAWTMLCIVYVGY